MTDPNFIELVCEERGVVLRLRLGPNGAKLTGGVGGTEQAEVPWSTAVTLWNGHPGYGQVIDVLLDGHQEQRSVADELHALYVIGRARDGETYPPTVELRGNARRTDLKWLVEDIDPDESEALARPDGALTRLPVSLLLVQDRRPEVAQSRSPSQKAKAKAKAKPKGSAGSGSRGVIYVVKSGDTLSRIAAQKKVKGGWKAIAKLNGLRDPNRLRVGQRLRLP